MLECARTTSNFSLENRIAKDLYTIKPAYHNACYTKLNRDSQRAIKISRYGVALSHNNEHKCLNQIYELIMDSLRAGKNVLKFVDLYKVYYSFFENMGISNPPPRPKLKEKIKTQFPRCLEQIEGRNLYLIFNELEQPKDVLASGSTSKISDAQILSKAVTILRKAIHEQ